MRQHKMNVRYVTCIYNGLNNSKVCGRLNRDRPYNYSLEAIARIKSGITCYTAPGELEKLRQYFIAERGLTNILLLPYDLYSLPFHNDVNTIRDREANTYRYATDWVNRCIEIMWGKFLFIKDVIRDNPNSEYIYWIDAGISHPGIIHSRFNPHYEHNINFVRDLDKETYPDTFKNYNIFNETFTENLVRYTGNNNILNIAAKGPQHGRLNPNNVFKGSVVGGLFGGNASLMNAYCDKVIEVYNEFLQKGILCKEEQIMTEILAENLFPIKMFTFDTWYHPDWGDDRFNAQTQISFCDFFDEMRK